MGSSPLAPLGSMVHADQAPVHRFSREKVGIYRAGSVVCVCCWLRCRIRAACSLIGLALLRPVLLVSVQNVKGVGSHRVGRVVCVVCCVLYVLLDVAQNASWGDISLVDAERRLLAHAYTDTANQHFVLLSESCIPVQSFETVYQYLMLSNHSYVEVYRDRNDNTCWTRDFLPLVPFQDWHKGSQWFEIQRDLVPIVLRDTLYYVKFGWTYMKWAYADEHYLPTMLRLKAAHRLANRTLTWVEWPLVRRGESTPHPVSFNSSTITPKLLKRIRWGWRCRNAPVWGLPCHLFARKFRPDALPILLKFSWYFGY